MAGRVPYVLPHLRGRRVVAVADRRAAGAACQTRAAADLTPWASMAAHPIAEKGPLAGVCTQSGACAPQDTGRVTTSRAARPRGNVSPAYVDDPDGPTRQELLTPLRVAESRHEGPRAAGTPFADLAIPSRASPAALAGMGAPLTRTTDLRFVHYTPLSYSALEWGLGHRCP